MTAGARIWEPGGSGVLQSCKRDSDIKGVSLAVTWSQGRVAMWRGEDVGRVGEEKESPTDGTGCGAFIVGKSGKGDEVARRGWRKGGRGKLKYNRRYRVRACFGGESGEGG